MREREKTGQDKKRKEKKEEEGEVVSDPKGEVSIAKGHLRGNDFWGWVDAGVVDHADESRKGYGIKDVVFHERGVKEVSAFQ